VRTAPAAGASGATYQQNVKDYVNLLLSNRITPILEMHWNYGAYSGQGAGCSSTTASCQKPIPDAQYAPQFWNATLATSGSTVTAASLSWNSQLDAGVSTRFGFLGTALTVVVPFTQRREVCVTVVIAGVDVVYVSGWFSAPATVVVAMSALVIVTAKDPTADDLPVGGKPLPSIRSMPTRHRRTSGDGEGPDDVCADAADPGPSSNNSNAVLLLRREVLTLQRSPTPSCWPPSGA
jgi:hypothetical protein